MGESDVVTENEALVQLSTLMGEDLRLDAAVRDSIELFELFVTAEAIVGSLDDSIVLSWETVADVIRSIVNHAS